MKVNGINYRTIWLDENSVSAVKIIDQRFLPHRFVVESIVTFEQMLIAITDMHLRGAGLIGVAAAYAVYLATIEAPKNSNFDVYIDSCAKRLIASRPTAVNLAWAVDQVLKQINSAGSFEAKVEAAKITAQHIADSDAASCKQIGLNGVGFIEDISRKKNGRTVNILTHCNAGWLAFADYGSALAPIYEAQNRGIDVHVWVDETRPRNQGASLTAWELLNQGIKHTLIPDNAGGHLMQHNMVDMVITGADRITSNGDVANKIGTYLKALAAADNNVPFYVAAPLSSFDFTLTNGIAQINVEQRNPDEVRFVSGIENGKESHVLICPEGTPAANYGFDVTPARLISAIICERGVCRPVASEIARFI